MTSTNNTFNKTYNKQDYTINRLTIGEYDQCAFVNCNFTESELSNCTFIESEFTDCNISMSRVKNTSFQEVKFIGCKILGVKFMNVILSY